mgnify:FL=1
MKNYFLILFVVWLGCATLGPGPQGIPGPQGEPGTQGDRGPQGSSGPAGEVDPDLIKKLEDVLNDMQSASKKEIVSASVHFSFGIAPPVLGFAVMTNYGRIYQLKKA